VLDHTESFYGLIQGKPEANLESRPKKHNRISFIFVQGPAQGHTGRERRSVQSGTLGQYEPVLDHTESFYGLIQRKPEANLESCPKKHSRISFIFVQGPAQGHTGREIGSVRSGTLDCVSLSR
jgi:hypothetical protein